MNRFLSYDWTQRDPVYAFFSRSASDTIVERRQGYSLCKFEPGLTPPVGLILFRRPVLLLLMEHMRSLGLYPDIDVPALLAKRGYTRYAYVPIGLYHTHAGGLRELVSKRLRNLRRVYLITRKRREYVWFDLSKREDFAKVALWILCVNAFFPMLVRSLYRSVKYRDWVFIYEPIVAVAITDSLIYGFLSEAQGRAMIRDAIFSLVGRRSATHATNKRQKALYPRSIL